MNNYHFVLWLQKLAKQILWQAGVTKVWNKQFKGSMGRMENQKIQKTPTLEKAILDHAPADYVPKIMNDPFKMENPSTGVSLYFANLLYQDLRFPCTLTNFPNFDKEITEKLL